MKINKAHCFFEQSGTFKNEFIKLGIPAEDYDIQNQFGETDHIIDLFDEINKAYSGGSSVFDNITPDDLIIAFFPCIYFCCLSQMSMSFTARNYRKKNIKETTDLILERSKNREYFFAIAVKMISLSKQRGLRLIMENPWSMQTFLRGNFVMPPTLIDKDRSLRGDYYKKETAYWFVNCEPTKLVTMNVNKNKIRVLDAKKSEQAGICSTERSMISPDYARNFICDFIIGKQQVFTQTNLFD